MDAVRNLPSKIVMVVIFGTILVVGSTVYLGAQVQAQEVPTGDIPSWVKDIAGFWSQSLIDDDAFVNVIQYLIEQDIIILSAMQEQIRESAETISVLREDIERHKEDNKKLEEMNTVLKHEIAFLEEDTEWCVIDCGVNFVITSCEDTSNDAHVKGIVENTGKETLRIEYTIYLTDALDNGVAIDTGIINSLAPGLMDKRCQGVTIPLTQE